MTDTARIFVGYDPFERDAYDVCVHSIKRHASCPLEIHAVNMDDLREQGFYRRKTTLKDNAVCDERDGKPFSTEFAFTRFLVPMLCRWYGWAIFMDGDMMVRDDIAKLWAMRRECYAVMCVKHDYRPGERRKKDGVPQEEYHRKNWSSMVLWNCGHLSNRGLGPDIVNVVPGHFLHGFEWLTDDEIGELPEAWNWLEGWSAPWIEPANVHFTRGGPWLENWRDVDFADEWRALRAEVRTAEYSQAV